jgi:hypothetical protein
MHKLYTSPRVYHDIETARNFFCNTVKCADTGYYFTFVVNPYTGENTLEDMVKLYQHFEFNQTEIVSFNGVHFDTPVLLYIIKNWKRLSKLSDLEICEDIKQFANLIIFSDEWWKIDWNYRDYRFSPFCEVDVFLYWSKELRKAKGISLKKLGIQLGYPVVQELPFDPTLPVPESSIPQIIEYNAIHDIGILELLMTAKFRWQGKSSSFEEMLQLRKDMAVEFNLPTQCYSWDSVKLGVRILLSEVKDQDKLIDKDVSFKIGDIISPIVSFEQSHCSTWNDKISKGKAATCFSAVYNDIQDKTVEDQISYRIYYNDTVFDMKKGGLHSKNPSIIYKPKPGYRLLTFDVASYYPSLAGLFVSSLSSRMTQLKDDRIALKDQGLGDSPRATGYKLGMNGSIGQTNQAESSVANPRFFYSITINGQFFLLMLVERLSALTGLQVVVANTDGCELMVPEHQIPLYEKICKQWQDETGMLLEFDEYQKIIMMNVNNYLAITKSGKPKTKGVFVLEPDLGNSSDFLIVPKLLHKYYLEGIKPEVAINQIPFNIMDYCGSQKVSKQFTVVYGKEEVSQRLNRYYISTEGKPMFKKKEGKRYAFPGLKGRGVVIYNNIGDKLLPIDQSFYIAEAYKIINEIKEGGTTLFD